MELNLPKIIPVKCPFCGYAWYTKARLKWITCSNCQRRFNKNKNRIEMEE